MESYTYAPTTPTQPIPESRATTTKLIPIAGYTIPIYQGRKNQPLLMLMRRSATSEISNMVFSLHVINTATPQSCVRLSLMLSVVLWFSATLEVIAAN
ncbi:hypothetical protein IG631_09968 [Alternaria alternata]|nr:hypothetical protein IG631_09968 [Alternaria alternata]